MTDRDCIHGSLARSCERCALEAEIDRLQERVATLEGERDDLDIQLHGCACPPPYDDCPHDEPLTSIARQYEARVATLTAGIRNTANFICHEDPALADALWFLLASHGEPS